MKTAHDFNPFHRIESWTGGFFKAAWLKDVGIKLHLGHHGQPCPMGLEEQVNDDANHEEDGEEGEEDPDEEDQNADHNNTLPEGVPLNKTKCVVVDTSGIHELPIVYCQCDDAEEKDIQLLRLRLWPASFIRIKTVFTFSLLSDFRLDNLATKTTAYHYFQKLRRVTNPAFPNTVPVCSLSTTCVL